jgi:acylphosphatase
MKRSIRLIVSGTVQGVGLREHIKKHAEQLGLQGTVQNVADGTVVVYVTGQDTQLEELIDAIYWGTPKTAIGRVAIESFTSHKDFRGVFRVIGDEN